MALKTKAEKQREQMRNAPEEDPEFQIAPMIDILLVLLVFFMSISSTEVLQSNRSISLPVAKDAKNPKDNTGQVILNVTWSLFNNLGTLEVNNVRYSTPYEVIPLLQDSLMKTPQTRVLIRADRSVRYEYMRQILKAVGDAGIANVTFSVVDKDVPAGPPGA